MIISIQANKIISELIKTGESGEFINRSSDIEPESVLHNKDVVYSTVFLNLSKGLDTPKLILLIRGMCLFDSVEGGFGHFGSTTIIPRLLTILKKRSKTEHDELVDWLFFNRTNPYIPSGNYVKIGIKSKADYLVYELWKKQDQKNRIALHEASDNAKHQEAIERKRKNQIEHIARSNTNRKLRNDKNN